MTLNECCNIRSTLLDNELPTNLGDFFNLRDSIEPSIPDTLPERCGQGTPLYSGESRICSFSAWVIFYAHLSFLPLGYQPLCFSLFFFFFSSFLLWFCLFVCLFPPSPLLFSWFCISGLWPEPHSFYLTISQEGEMYMYILGYKFQKD